MCLYSKPSSLSVSTRLVRPMPASMPQFCVRAWVIPRCPHFAHILPTLDHPPPPSTAANRPPRPHNSARLQPVIERATVSNPPVSATCW